MTKQIYKKQYHGDDWVRVHMFLHPLRLNKVDPDKLRQFVALFGQNADFIQSFCLH